MLFYLVMKSAGCSQVAAGGQWYWNSFNPFMEGCGEFISLGKEGVGYVMQEHTVGCGPNKTPVTERKTLWGPVEHLLT